MQSQSENIDQNQNQVDEYSGSMDIPEEIKDAHEYEKYEDMPDLIPNKEVPDLEAEIKNLQLEAEIKSLDLKKVRLATDYEFLSQSFKLHKNYTLHFLNHLIDWQIKLFDEINMFIGNVRNTDRTVQHRSSLRRLRNQCDAFLRHLKDIKEDSSDLDSSSSEDD